ncbi:4217_t:CDS:2, partial [Paraglomus occultum]
TRIKILASFENFLKAGLLRGEDTLKLIFISYLRSQQARNSFMNQDTRRQKRNVVDWVACHGKVNMMPPHPLTLLLLPQLSSSPIQPTLGLFSHSISSSLSDSKDDKMSMSTVTLKGDRSVHTNRDGAMEIEYDTATIEGRIAITQTIITTLHQLLLSTWLDTAPVVFGSITSTIYQSPGLLLLNHILRILDVLWRAFFIESREKNDDARKLWTDSQTQQLLKHITLHFPYGADSFGMRDAKTESILREMNIICCNLVVIYLLNSSTLSLKNDHEDSSSMMQKTNPDAAGGRLSWAGRVFDYVLITLGGTESIRLEHEISFKMKLTSTDFKPEHLTSLLPSIWGLLNCIDDNDQILLYQ